ncbi:MAG: hypothetical protein QXY18_02085 [Nitrososphaerota archaeon]
MKTTRGRLYHLGFIKNEKIENENSLSWFKYFLRKLGISKKNIKVKKEQTPIFWTENSHIAYRERLSKLLEE